MASSILDVLRLMGRGAKKAPRLLDSAINQRTPTMGPDMLPSVQMEPGAMEPASYENEDDELQSIINAMIMGKQGIDSGPIPTGGTRVIGEEKAPRQWTRRLMDSLPGMIEGGIAAAATPNVALGGPTDFFRALQSGLYGPMEGDVTRGQASAARDSMSPEAAGLRQRRALADTSFSESRAEQARRALAPATPDELAIDQERLELERRKAEADIFLKQAQARNQNAQAQKALTPAEKTAAQQRFEYEQKLIEEYLNPETAAPRRAKIAEVMKFTQERGVTQSDRDLALAAVNPDHPEHESAKKAWALLEGRRRSDDSVTARQRNASVARAWSTHTREKNRAQEEFDRGRERLQRAKDHFDSEMTDEEYEERLGDLEDTLRFKLDSARDGLEESLAAWGEAPGETPRRKTAKPKGKEETLPPEISAQIPEGKRVTFLNQNTGKTETWQRLNGQLTKVN